MREATRERWELLLIKIDSKTIGISKDKLEVIETTTIRITVAPTYRLDTGFD
jgi:hypothetical protein